MAISNSHAGGARMNFAALWRERAAQGGPRPFLTFRDEATGERVELSFATFGNWLAKTANFIQDDLMTPPGDRVALLAPPHWLTAVWAVAPLLVSAAVDPWGDAAAAQTVVTGPGEDVLAAGRDCDGERLAMSLLPLGRPFAEVPAGYRDFTAEVRAFADAFGAFDPPGVETDALVVDGRGRVLTHGELVELAQERAEEAGLEAGDRVLVDARTDRFSADELVDWLYAPLVAGASTVLVRGLGLGDGGEGDGGDRRAELIERIAETERVTKRGVVRS